MILRRIALAGWKSFLEEVGVGPFSEGLNLIYGPNGSGKSTLFEALRMGIFDSYTVRGREVERIRPWGRELSPRVTLEFTRGGGTYRLEKQFLEGAFSRLERLEGGRFRPFMEGRKADEFVRGLFSKRAPGRGLSRAEHLGLCQVLWAPQGGLEAGSLPEETVDTVKGALGIQVSLAAGGEVERRIGERYREIYTAKGKLKTGKDAPVVVKLRARVEEIRGMLEEARREYKAYMDAVREVEDRGLESRQAALEAVELRKEVAVAEERAARFEALEKERKAAEAEEKEAKARLEEVVRALERAGKARAEVESLEREVVETEAELEAAGKEAAHWEERVREAREKVLRARRERERVETARKRAEGAAELVEGRKRLDEIRRTIRRLEEVLEELEEARKERAGVHAPDEETLRSLERLATERMELEAEIRAGSIRLEILPERPLDVEVLQGEDQGKGDPGKGERLEILGSPEVEMVIGGVGRIRAGGPSGDLEGRRRRLGELEEEMERLAAPFGTRDPAVLAGLRERARALDGRVEKLEDRLSTLLQGKRLEDFRADEAREEAGIRAVLELEPGWKEEAPDPRSLRQAYEEARKKAEEETALAERVREEAEAGIRRAGTKLEALKERLEGKREALEKARARLAAEGPKEELEKRKDELLLEWERLRKPLERLEKEQEAFREDPRDVYVRLKKRLEGLEERAREARDREMAARGRLRELAGRGVYGRLARLEEEAEVLEEEAGLEEERALAVKLLWETVEKFRNRVTRRVVEPVERDASRILERIAGSGPGRVVLGESLEPAGVVPPEVRDPVGLESLSGGEREQLHFACRLALAGVLAREERRLLVLDDVLTATDTARFARILGLLEEAAEGLQVVILSCHPERYAGVEGMARFDLERIAAGG